MMHSQDYELEGTTTESVATSDTERVAYKQPTGTIGTMSVMRRKSTASGRLAPLLGREDDIDHSHPNPPLVTPRISPTKGGEPSQAGDYTISLPVGGGSIPKHGGGAIVSVPGDQPLAYRSDHRETLPMSTVRAVDMVVYFADKTGISLSVEDGQNAEAGEIFEMVMEEMRFPHEARQAFSLWLVSDYLELQLKPHHVPFKLAAYWEELLERYVDISEQNAERDEPVLVFQRNVFFSRIQEQQLQSRELFRLLYHEAKEMVIDARYPLNADECDYLAGMQALLTHSTYQQDQHGPKYYSKILSEYYPKHLCKKKGLFSRDAGAEDRLANAHQRAHKKFGDMNTESQRVVLYKKYLEFCWKLPYYGAAFFRGQIEHPGKPRFFSVNDDPVFIAVNTEGVFITDMDDNMFLMGLLYEQMAWNYAEPKNKENPNCLPCLFFQFNDKQRDGRTYKKVLQVFTREAKLVDSLMESCLRLKLDKKQRGEDVTDGIPDEDRDGVIEALGKTWENFNRLCITTFNDKGDAEFAKGTKHTTEADWWGNVKNLFK